MVSSTGIVVLLLSVVGMANCTLFYKYAIAGIVPKMSNYCPDDVLRQLVDLRVSCMKLYDLDPRKLYDFETEASDEVDPVLAKVADCNEDVLQIFDEVGNLNMETFNIYVKDEMREGVLTCMENHEPTTLGFFAEFYDCFVQNINKIY